MIGKNLKYKFMLAALASLLMSCGSSSEDSQDSLAPTPVNESVSQGLCSTNSRQGSQVMATSLRGSRLQDSGYFGKPLKIDSLERALSLSALDIAKALVNDGVRLFHVVENPRSSCQYFSFLQPANRSAQNRWNGFSRQNTPGNTLLGLFTTVYRRSNAGFAQLEAPTIILRHDTQKWTLLHEMTHYLFAQGRVQRPGLVFNSELNTEIANLRSAVAQAQSQYRQNPQAHLAQRLSRLWTQLYNATFELDRRGPMEEFAIEAMLFERGIRGQITAISLDSGLRLSLSYMFRNARLVERTYRDIKQKVRRQQRRFRRNNNNRAADNLENIISEIDRLIGFMNRTIERAQASQGPQVLGSFDTDEDHEHHHGAQHFNVEEFLENHRLLQEL